MASSEAFIISAFNKEGLLSTRDFSYNDGNLMDYMYDYGTMVVTDAIDTSKQIEFSDSLGNKFESCCGVVKCCGEPLDDNVHVRVEVASNIPIDGKRFLGTYSEIDIFPDSMNYGDASINVDLDCDGVRETVFWEFQPAGEPYNEGYYYSVKIKNNLSTYSLKSYQAYPLQKDDFEVFVVDIDMNGDFEVLVYTKEADLFSIVEVFDFGNEDCVFSYVLVPFP